MVKRLDRFYTPQLPLSRGKSFDYDYIRNLEYLVKQNLKNILLTIPGERVMDPEFGVGISTFLFENFGSFEEQLKTRIFSQVSRYAQFVELKNVLISGDGDSVLHVELIYHIPSLSVEDQMSVGVKKNTASGGPKFLV